MLNWEQSWLQTGMTLVGVGLIFYSLRLFNAKRLFHEAGWGSLVLAIVCLILSLIVRSQTAQYFALSNMYESLWVVCISILLAFVWMDRWFQVRSWGMPVTLLVMGALIYDITLPTEIKPLQPALQSYWRSIHVPVILMSYALFTLAFLASLVYLVKDYWQGWAAHAFSNKGAQHLAMAGGPQAVLSEQRLSDTALAMDLNAEIAVVSDQEQANIYDEITYRCVAFGFPLLTVGIILGGLWANEAWGNYWSWDPKESMSLVTLLGYGVYLHMRVNQEHSPRILAWVSVVGFVLMLVTYFGVNLMGIGLHSYGKIG